MKTNFKNKSKTDKIKNKKTEKPNDTLTQEEFEDYVIKSGARGSFMVYRSKRKNDELGMDEL
jgi:hypothetical protein